MVEIDHFPRDRKLVPIPLPQRRFSFFLNAHAFDYT